MVNFVSIVHLSSVGTFSFRSFQDFWTFYYTGANPSHKVKLDRLLQLMAICEQTIHEKYFIPLDHIKNIGFVFVSTAEAIRRMEYSEDRELLLNPANKVVLQIREMPDTTQTVATVYTSDYKYHIITSASNMAFVAGRHFVLSSPGELGRQQ